MLAAISGRDAFLSYVKCRLTQTLVNMELTLGEARLQPLRFQRVANVAP